MKLLEYLGEGDHQVWTTVATKGLELELVIILTAYISIDLSSTRFVGHMSNIMGNVVVIRALNISHNECNVIYHQHSETQIEVKSPSDDGIWPCNSLWDKFNAWIAMRSPIILGICPSNLFLKTSILV